MYDYLCTLSIGVGFKIADGDHFINDEAEYIALSTAAREVIPILSLAKEAADHQVIDRVEKSIIHCKMFEDNEGAVEKANVPKMRP
jgi:hypothetical protein